MRTRQAFILVILFSIASILAAQNTETKYFEEKILSSFETWDVNCNGPNSTISFVLPEGALYDITSIDFGYSYQAMPGFAPINQRSQLYFENLDKESPIYTGTIEDAGETEIYEQTGFSSFNDTFCGNDTLKFQLRLWREEGLTSCSDEHFVPMNSFFVKLYYSDMYAAKVIIGDSVKSSVLDVKGNIKIANIQEIEAESGMMKFDATLNDFQGYDGYEWRSFTNHAQLLDQDSDTKITVEQSPDDDVVKIYNEGVHYFSFDRGRIDVLNNGKSVFLGNQAGKMHSGSEVGNVAIGDSALTANITKLGIVAIGNKALKNNGSTGILPKSGADNSAIGYESMEENTSGYKNTAVGYRSLSDNTSGNFNVAIGSNSMENNISGYSNVGVGMIALAKNETGYQNIAIGRSALTNNISGDNNISMGSYALSDNISGINNIAIGTGSLRFGTVQSSNIAIGFEALSKNGSGNTDTTLGIQNTAVGHESQSQSIVGNSNTSIGFQTLKNNTAYQNTALGALSLQSNLGGFDNTAVGFESLNSNTTGTKNTAFGSRALSQSSSSNNTAIGSESMQNHVFGSYNTALGYRSLQNGNGGNYNTTIGSSTLINNSGNYNTALGYNVLKVNTSGFENTYIGSNSGGSNTSGKRNVALGFESLNGNQSADELTAIGYRALSLNTLGEGNTAVGYSVLLDNVSGDHNTAVGYTALFENTANRNTAMGYQSLRNSTSGHDNTAFGNNSMEMNTNGFDNVGVGSDALSTNTSGFYNVALGSSALKNLTSGEGNIAIGFGAFSQSGTFDVCTSIGYNADGGYTNSTALGYSAALSSGNQVRIGNAFVSSIGGFANWSNVSDRRFKKDIQSNVKGLDFINNLRPVTYHYDIDAIKDFHNENNMAFPDKIELGSNAESKLLSGFIAQEVEQAAIGLGYDFSGVDKPEGEGSYYGLRYAEFVVPLVKAVQEMDQKIQNYENVIKLLQEQNAQLQVRLSTLEKER